MTEIEIRALTADDVEAYWSCRLEALERDPTAFSSSVEDHLKLSRDEIRRRLAADPANNFVMGAFADGKLVGTAGFARETQPKMRHKGRIWGVYLKAEIRGKGVGRRLMQAVLDRATKIQGVEQILISVATTQAAAVALYRSLGFTTWGEESRALKVGDRYIDEEYMILPLPRTADPSSGWKPSSG
ncbi:MAG: N-acetyltransferase family protein [Candidatus Korobacteraceae bacterium]|jgi:ribosomal protein S18 acetylase RimI-like enzyme